MELINTENLPREHPSLVPDFWAKAIMQHPDVSDAVRKAALDEAKLPADLITHKFWRITQAHETVLIDSICRLLGEPDFAAKAGYQQELKHGSVLTYMLLASANMEDFIALFCRYLPSTRAKAWMRAERAEDGFAIIIGNADPEINDHGPHAEFATATMLRLLEIATGWGGMVRRVEFQHKAGGEREIEEILGCEVCFEQAERRVILKEEVLDYPVLSADEALLEHLRAYSDILLRSHLKHEEESPAVVIREAIGSSLAHGVPPLPKIAANMGLSERTLSRRLAARGMSYRQVVEELRYDLAQHYLADLELSLAEIAFLLGFSDQSSFGTAFRRWSGSTPRQFRMAL